MDKSLLDRLILVADNLRDVEWELKHRVGHIYIPPEPHINVTLEELA